MARKPFFMRFVETNPENKPEVRTDVKAGADGDWRKALRDKGYETMKYPSDGDEEYTW
ncbi:MAG: microviridin/marinostatin family tricyclic proteinase inhibitor [Alphaproteobacteria bacterium]|nr:microviridin/marinostatin family tricyclic proteinase inhibitor [Alphaproteobacteria bacterium]MCB9758199.1 microviridin/marinostatin family tricyclic proteinase inhibitor [Alphaproteobacteria bacterium]MCB9795106.1 microviridin/marinostatin family tricyclic proteinase inhibitor [Alphaproteobacteria bacterium]